jgi:hypothetical protein
VSGRGIAVTFAATCFVVALLGCALLLGMVATNTSSVPDWTLGAWLGSSLALGICVGLYAERLWL